MTTTTTGIDPHRRRAAAHELGHLIIWRANGFHVPYAEISGHGELVSGIAHLDRQCLRSLDQACAYLAGLLAGEQAEIAWCEQNNMAYNERAAEGDMDRYRWFMRKNRGIFPPSITLPHLQRTARQAVRAKWPTIERLIPDLALAGRIR